jgi:UDP-arabinose 4-epimerase
MGASILVTGGAGYIGSHTCKALASAGYRPIVLDNLSEGHRWAVKWGPLVVGDIADRELLLGTVKRHDIEAILHFAAHADVGESVRRPKKYFSNNFSKTLTLLDSMIEGGVLRVVFSSSCATYGLPRELLISESHRQQPINPYGASKLFVENALHWYGEAYGIRYTSLRYFNAAGADLGGELGEAHDPETHLVPRVIAAAQGRSPAVEIFGTDYNTPDGTAVRDYVHVTDLATAHVKAIARLLEGGGSASFNLGTGRGHTIREVISAVEKIGGRKVPVREGPRRPGDPPVLIADASSARAVVGWTPQFSDMTTIVQTAWNWHQRNVEPREISLQLREPVKPELV